MIETSLDKLIEQIAQHPQATKLESSYAGYPCDLPVLLVVQRFLQLMAYLSALQLRLVGDSRLQT